MIRKLTCKSVEYLEGEEIQISLTSDDVSNAIIEFDLLLYSKIDKIIAEDFGTRSVVKLSMTDESKKSYCDSGCSEIILSQNNAEYIVSYLLTYVRDYSVEVNHIHVELYDKETGEYSCELTLFLEV